jgi:phosphoribosylformimino-5-aminoimidazole carboxamide ribotide isomerase
VAFELIGVIDIRAGRAVHAVAGARERYQPVQPIAGVFTAPGDAEALARFYIDPAGVDAIYVADLDAIQGGALQITLLSSLCELAIPIYVDAGVTTVDAARRVLTAGAERIIVGLETLASFDDLAAICAALGGDRVVFSLDFRDGRALSTTAVADDTPEALTMRAVRAGVQSLIVIDLARVGVGAGLDLEVIGRVRTAAPPHVTVMAGGGIRDWNDLERVAAAGCDGALVASALQDGRLSAQDLARAKELPISRPRSTQ